MCVSIFISKINNHNVSTSTVALVYCPQVLVVCATNTKVYRNYNYKQLVIPACRVHLSVTRHRDSECVKWDSNGQIKIFQGQCHIDYVHTTALSQVECPHMNVTTRHLTCHFMHYAESGPISHRCNSVYN